MNAKCNNCGKVSPEDTLLDVSHLSERVEAGGEVPAGECPGCGSLAYLVDDDEPRDAAMKVVNALREQVTTNKGTFSTASSATFLVCLLRKHGFEPAQRGPCRK